MHLQLLVLTVPLGIGVILPSFHAVGNIPVEIYRTKTVDGEPKYMCMHNRDM